MTKKKWENPTINALTASPKNRNVRVHDSGPVEFLCTRTIKTPDGHITIFNPPVPLTIFGGSLGAIHSFTCKNASSNAITKGGKNRWTAS